MQHEADSSSHVIDVLNLLDLPYWIYILFGSWIDPSQLERLDLQFSMAALDEMTVEERRSDVRWAVERYPVASALDQQQLDVVIDRILEQSHPENLHRRDGRRPRHDLATALIIADHLGTGSDARAKRLLCATDQANLLTKGYLEVDDDYYANQADFIAWTAEEWKKVFLRAADFGMADDDATVVHQGYTEQEEEVDEDEEVDDGVDQGEYELYYRMWVKVVLSTSPEAVTLEPHELEAAVDRILDPAPAEMTCMNIADIRLVLAHKSNEPVDEDGVEMEEFQAQVRRDLIATGYVEVDPEYWSI
ncbi:hypothetical protein BRADI_3g48747v3 [Brachypodium distachyon]|uniref:Uncharacterized protein n=1 Tax=Brachypodium distachyon TaxID=15368 RepID=A0A2K2D454_BRADI|nr:hypothetical protein BRADI_3g48747v3 [Brachypodium distachyon]